MENIEKGCRSVYNLSLKDFGTQIVLPGKQKIKPNKGFASVIQALVSKHETQFYSKLKTNHILEKILLCEKLDQSDDDDCAHCYYTKDSNKVVLLVRNQIESKELILICNNVVMTASLGYLKANLGDLIQPDRFIPKEKTVAVARMGFGNFFKIYLIYEQPFWEKNFSGLRFIWLPKYNDESIEAIMRDGFDNEKKWFHSITGIDTVYSQDNVLCAYVSAHEGLSEMDENEIAAHCSDLLRKFFYSLKYFT